MSANPADACGLLDQSIPQWKRELIIRRRALGRTLQVGSSSVKLTCPAVVAIVRQPEGLSAIDAVTNKQLPLPGDVSSSSFSSLNQNSVDFHPSTSSAVAVRNMRLLDASNDVNNLVISDVEVKNKQGEVSSDICVNYNLIMGEDKSFSSKKKRSTSRSKCDQNNSIKKQQNLFINQVSSEGMNGKSKNDEDGLSDSSEELQYGPGIVNKLKTKYLSMTLREQKRQLRPSIINLRRATSLENMLEGDGNMNKQSKSTEETSLKTEIFSVNTKSTTLSNSLGLNSHRAMKYLGNRSLETMKRARSMDTLLKSESRTILNNSITGFGNKQHFMNQANDFTKPIASIVNENIIIVENVPASLPNNDSLNDLIPSNDLSKHLKRSIPDEKELPPPDLVKQALKIFETSPKKSLKPPSQNNLSKNLVGIPNSNNQAVNNRTIDKGKNNFSKPSLSPKPILSPERLKQNRSRMTGSPKKSQNCNDTVLVNPLQSSRNGQHITKPQPQVDTTESISNVNTNISVKPSKTGITSPKVMSPRSISPVVTVLSNNEQGSSTTTVDTRSSSIKDSQNMLQNTDEVEEIDGRELSKSVPEGALENIRRGGVSMQFSFSNENSLHNKSYLPRSKSPPQAVNTSLIKDKLEKSPPASIAPLRSSSSTHTKQVGIIRPLVTSKMQSTYPPSPPLTEQEIEKNLINRVKSIEQPISKVVVAIKAHPDNVVLGTVSPETVTNKNLTLPRVSANPKTRTQGLWDDKHWHQNQNTIVFNFSDRKEVPDYIENDGLIFRGIRDRPRPGEDGIILLDSGGEESSTDVEELDPPSPCDVTFVGDNVLINGKSNLKKSPKQVKLRIKFNDEATTMFEYPSEASLAEEETVQQDNTDGDTSRTQSLPSPSLPLALGVPPPDYLPPPVPTKALKTSSFPSLQVPDRVLLPQNLPVVRPPVPVRTTLYKSPSAPTSRNIALSPVVSSSSTVTVEKETPLASPTTSSTLNKEKYYSKKKTRVSGKIEVLPNPLQIPLPTLQNPNDNFDQKSDNLISKQESSASVARVPPAVFSKDKSQCSPFPDFYSSSIFLDSNPAYCPVYSTPISVKTSTCSTPTVGELKVNPLLPVLSEQSLNCQVDKASLCTDSVTGGTLGAYTPRKMGTGEWQLGVTPVQQPSTSPAPLQPPPQDHLKPAPPESTVVWSEDTASDLLF